MQIHFSWTNGGGDGYRESIWVLLFSSID